jgi:hypothetical protein
MTRVSVGHSRALPRTPPHRAITHTVQDLAAFRLRPHPTRPKPHEGKAKAFGASNAKGACCIPQKC